MFRASRYSKRSSTKLKGYIDRIKNRFGNFKRINYTIRKDFNQDINNWYNKWNVILPPDIALAAITHPSYRGIDPSTEDYERFEFVGDAVLDLITSEELFFAKEILDEAAMTLKRTEIVNNNYLAAVFEVLELSKIVRTASNYSLSQKDKSNFVESILGAMFVSSGYEKCKNLWNNIQKTAMAKEHEFEINYPYDITPEQELLRTKYHEIYESLKLVPKNSVSTLQELCTGNGNDNPVYHEIDKQGPDHKPLFKIEVVAYPFSGSLRKEYIGIGNGTSKKRAKLLAAADICNQIFLPYRNN